MSRRSSNSSARSARSRQNKVRSHFSWTAFFFKIFFLCFVVVAVVLAVYWWRASQLDLRRVEQMKERSTVFDMDGKIWGRLQGENRVPVGLSDVSPYFIGALLAREDVRFFSHPGVDLKGIARAVVRTIQGQSQGGSTLTQQLARNSFDELGQRKSIDRKLLELFVALRIERKYSKEEVLSHYMNRIYFGSGVYGIEMAAKVYFGKSARDLTLSEAAMIAGIIRAPTRASPFSNPKRARAEREMVLDRLVSPDSASIRKSYGIKTDAIALARKQTLKVVAARHVSAQENYAMDMVMREMDVLLDDEQQIQGGLKIYTTIDPALQDEAQKSLDRALTKIEQRSGYAHPTKAAYSAEARRQETPTEYLQGAVVAVDNHSGGIRVLVGGRDYRDSKYNRAIDARRTVGSTFKPFVYAAAFSRGLSPDTEISDGPIEPGEIKDGGTWHPGNSDGQFGGMLPAADGLIRSRNTMTVRVGDFAGIQTVAKIAAGAGISDMPLNPQSYIGNFGVSPKDLVMAYSVLANNGIRRQPYIIERIDSADGEIVYRAAHINVAGLDRKVCAMTTDVLVEVMQRGTAAASRALGWSRPAAGKTGTTDDYHDAWFAAYTTSLTCGVWVGLDKPATIVPKGYGAALALPVWVDVMKRASADKYPAGLLGTGTIPRAQVTGVPVAKTGGEEGGLRKPEPQAESGILRSFRKFFGGR